MLESGFTPSTFPKTSSTAAAARGATRSPVVCPMGQTTGDLVDPRAAAAVLDVLGKVLGVKPDSSILEDKAKEIDAVTRQLHAEMPPGRDLDTDLHYIG